LEIAEMIDLHNHTHFGDGSDSPATMVRQAAAAGMTVFGLSEHFPRPEGYNYPVESFNHRALAGRWFDYASEVQRLKARGGEGPEVLFGAEIDYIPEKEQWIRAEVAAFNFDYVIGSVHMIDTWGFDYLHHDWNGKDADALYTRYYEILVRLVRSGIADFLGHMDLIKVFKHIHPPGRDHTDEAIGVLGEVARAGAFIEINTGALRKPCKELSPAPDLIREAVRLKIPFTLGSDAHRKGDIGYYFPEVVGMLKDLGVREIAYFQDRKPVFIALPSL
jgi:histidinol-phosphatase (PHP family)